MRQLPAILGAMLVCSAAWAQPPAEVIPEGEISVGLNEVKVFHFADSVSTINVITKGTIQANAQTDHQVSIVGLAAGETQMFLYSADGKTIYSATVTVTPEAGHLVKIYGTGKNEDVNAGFISTYCNGSGCGRPDKDLPTPSVSVERVSRGSKDNPPR